MKYSITNKKQIQNIGVQNNSNQIQPFNDEQQLVENNVIRDVVENLDKDQVDQKTGLTSIDFNTRLTNSEIGSIVALQMLDVLDVGGSPCSLIARSIKRHKVSLGGEGRKEKVKIVQGDREHEEQKGGSSIFGKVKGFLNGNKNE